jgi:uncharacterized protein (TIGR02996 family)
VTISASDDELLAAILDYPSDDERRAVYADRLVERGDPRGEFIALQLARARRGLAADEEAREQALLRKHEPAWLDGLSRLLAGSSVVWERGFLAACIMVPDRRVDAELARPIFATVTRLGVARSTGDVAAFVLHPRLRALVALAANVSLAPRLPGTSLGARLAELHVDGASPVALPSLVESASGLPALRRLRYVFTGGGGEPERAEVAARLLDHPTLRWIDIVFAGVRVQVKRADGAAWRGDVAFPTGHSIGALVSALIARGVEVRIL